MDSLLRLKKLGTSLSMKLPQLEPKLTPEQKSFSLRAESDTKTDFFTFDHPSPNPLKSSKSSLKSKLSILTEFGILPGKGLKLPTKPYQDKIIEPKIKFFDLMGKKNAEKLFKMLDLNTIIESAEAENIDENAVKKLLIANKPEVFVQFKPTYNIKTGVNAYRKKKLMTANGPRDLLRRKNDIGTINKIMDSCDQLRKKSKLSSDRLPILRTIKPL